MQMEQHLHESEARYRTLIEHSPDAVVMTDLDGTVRMANPRAVSLYGVPDPDVMLGRNVLEMVAPEERERAQGNLRLTVERGNLLNSEYVIRRPDGSQFSAEVNGTVLTDAAGLPSGLMMTVRDLTERHQAEAAAQQLALIVNRSPAVALQWGAPAGWPIAFVSDNITQFGYAPEELARPRVGFVSLVHPEDRARVLAEVSSFTREGALMFNREYRLFTRTGATRWVDDRTWICRDAVGTVTHYESIVLDVTERKRAEEIVQENELKYRTLFDSANDGIFILENGLYVECNDQAVKLFGGARDQILRHSPFEFSPEVQLDGEDSISKGRKAFLTVQAGRPQFFEWQHRRLDGTLFEAEVSLNCLEVQGRTLLQAVVRDISERKQWEQSLQREQANLKAIFASAPVGMLLLNEALEVVDSNRGLEVMVPGELEAIIGHRWGQALGCASSHEKECGCGHGTGCPTCPMRQSLQQVLATGERVHGLEVQPTLQGRGQTVRPWLRLSAEPVQLNGCRHVIVAVDDITSLKQSQAALAQSRDHYLTLFENFPTLIWRTGTDAKCNYVNQTWLDFTGRTLEQETGDGWLASVHPDDREARRRTFAEGFEQHRPFAMDYRRRRADGAERWIRDCGRPFKDLEGQFAGFIGSCFDITERKEAEEKLQRRLAIEELVACVSHRFLQTTPETMSAQIVEVLQAIGQFTGADRCHLNLLSPDEERFEQSFEWHAEGLAPKARLLEGRSLRPLQWALPQLRQHGVINIPSVAELPPAARAEQELIQWLEIGSLVIMPLVIEGRLVGLYGLSSQEAGKEWANENVRLLQLVAEVLLTMLSRHRSELALRENQRQLATLMSNLPGMAYRCLGDEDWTMLFASEGCLDLTGYPAEAFLHNREKAFAELIHPEDRVAVAREIQDAVKRQAPYRLNYRIRTAQGAEKWVWEQGRAIYTDEGSVVALEGFIADVTERKQAEAALRQSEERFRLFAETIGEVFWMADVQIQETVYVSPGYERIWGRSPESLYAAPRSFIDSIHPEDRERVASALSQRGSNQSFQHEYRIRRPDGSERWIWDRGFPVRNPEGTATHYVGVAQDITERRQAEAALQQSEERLRLALEAGQLGVFEHNLATEQVAVTPEFCQILGLPPSRSLAHQAWTERMHPDDRERIEAGVRRLVKEQVPFQIEYRLQLDDGSERWVRAMARPLVQAGNVQCVHGVLQDITRRKHAEAAQRESQQQYSSLVENLPIGLFRKTPEPDGRFVMVNQALARMYGCQSPAELLRCKPIELIAQPEAGRQLVENLARQDSVDGLELQFKKLDGTPVWCRLTTHALRNADGTVEYFDGTVEDITARKQAEQQVADALHFNQTLLQASPVGVLAYRATGETVMCNQALARMIGATQEEVLAQNFRQLASWQRSELLARAETALTTKTEQEFDTHLMTSFEREIWISCRMVPFTFADQPHLLVLFADIAARKRAEEESHQNETLLCMMIDSSPDWIFIKDQEHRYVLVNECYARDMGCSKDEFVGKNDLEMGFPEAIVKGDPARGIRGFWQDDREVMDTGQPKFIAEESANLQGRIHILDTYKFPLRDADGEVWGVLGYARDITERKQAEREKAGMQIQLNQAQKLESIGRLAAGIAHEINTPTQFIGDNNRFLQDSFKDLRRLQASFDQLLEAADAKSLLPELTAQVRATAREIEVDYLATEIPKALQQSLEGVERVSKIVRAMKEFSHPGGGDKSAIDLNRAIESTVTVARNEWKYVAELALDLEPSLPPVQCLADEFNQVILNLIINAAHAIADVVGDSGRKGTITVSTRKQDDWVEIRVGDTGSGIPEPVRPHLFEPFFTTKPVGQGTGQGLAIARSVVVDKHNGTIDFETELGRGTTFIVRLPLKETENLPRKAAA